MTPSDPPNPSIKTQSSHSQLNRPAYSGYSAFSWLKTGVTWLAMALPILVFFLVWRHYAVNVPKWDDHALRAFLFYSDQETTLSGKIYQLFRQHNEHRIVYDRMITALDYWLFGKLNYIHLMVVGNLSLIGLLAVFAAVLHRGGRTLVYAVPVALLLFNLSQWENMFWGMAALQNFSVVLWVVTALYLLSYTDHLGLAMVSAVLATLTSGNGLTIWSLGLAVLLLRPNASINRHALRPLLIWFLAAVTVIILYFTGFEKPGDIAYARPGVFALLKGWFAVVGALAEALPFGSALRNCVLLGGLMTIGTLGIGGWTAVTQWKAVQQNFKRVFGGTGSGTKPESSFPPHTLFFWSCAAFILGTAAIVAWARTSFGADLLMTSRYKIYSLTLLALLYVYGVTTLPKPVRNWVSVAGGAASFLIAWLSYYSFLDDTIWWRHYQLTNQFNWTHSTNRPVVQRDSVSQRYTDLAPAFYETGLSALYQSSLQANVPVSVTKGPVGYIINNSTVSPLGLLDEGAYMMARSTRRIYLFPTHQKQTSPAKAWLWPAYQFTNGFLSDISSNQLEAGQYTLFVLMVDKNNQMALYPTNQTITSSGPPSDTPKKNW